MSDDNVVPFPGDGMVAAVYMREENICDPKDVLTGALETPLTKVVLVGVADDGRMYVATSARYMADALMMIKRAELMIVEADRNC